MASAKLLTADFMTEVASKLKINTEKVKIENQVFRIFSKVTFAILIVSCGLVTLHDFIGGNIKCLTPKKEDLGDNAKAVTTYCFIMSTYTLPHLFNKTIGIHTPHFGVGPYIPENEEHETKYHNYYQWVPFVLLFQALLFLLPHYIWKSVEGNKMKTYCNLEIADKVTLKQRVLLVNDKCKCSPCNDCNKCKKCNKCTKCTNCNCTCHPCKYCKKVKTFSMAAEYFTKSLNYNHFYAYAYIFCEILNFVIVILNIYITDAFLGHQFSNYGPSVVKFLSQDPEDRKDPLNEVFPKVTKCDFHKYGPGGNLINYDVMCILPINILNEKIYTFLWFWFVIVAIIGGLGLIYRIMMLFIPRIRTSVIKSRALRYSPQQNSTASSQSSQFDLTGEDKGLEANADDRSAVDFIAKRISYSDWFILKRLSDNLNRLRFGELCQNIRQTWPDPNHHIAANGGSSSQTSPTNWLVGTPPPNYHEDVEPLKGMARKLSKDEQEHESDQRHEDEQEEDPLMKD